MRILITAASAAAVLFTTLAAVAADPVNVYSYRKEELIRPILNAFTEETGIEVNLITGNAGELHQRLKSEGKNTPADVLVTVDAGNLSRAKEDGLLQPIKSEVLEKYIPEHLRDPEGYWFGLSKRARVFVYSPDRVDPSELSTYFDLADEKWRNRLLIRSSTNIYNQSLIAAMISEFGEEKTEEWARGLVANFARRPQGGDSDQIHAVEAGEGDLALVNTYYYGRMLASDDADERAAAQKLRVFFPNQDGRGTHVNVSGAGVTAYAPHKENAVKLLEFMVGEEAQELFANSNQEYPARQDVAPSKEVASWGTFKEDNLNLSVLGELNKEAVMLADRVGWR